MNIKTLSVTGLGPALYAMRAPMTSFKMSDSTWERNIDGDIVCERFTLGEKDKELSTKLQTAGTEHYKHLRMIHAYAEIDASLYW